MMDRQTDIQTHRQTQGEKQYVSRPLHGGDIIHVFYMTERSLRMTIWFIFVNEIYLMNINIQRKVLLFADSDNFNRTQTVLCIVIS